MLSTCLLSISIHCSFLFSYHSSADVTAAEIATLPGSASAFAAALRDDDEDSMMEAGGFTDDEITPS